jgi:hypothetical protein
MKYEKYDAILCVNQILKENDERMIARRAPIGYNKGFTQYVDVDDPKLYNSFTFGNAVRQSLNNMGNGFTARVTDFKKWIVVDVSHHNTITGKSASKTFLIVFDGGPKGNDPAGGMVLTTASKWRTISGTSQAVSYIKSASSALESETSKKL